MKVSALIVAAAVGLATAAPIRVVVIRPANPNPAVVPADQAIDSPLHLIRFGHAAANANPQFADGPTFVPDIGRTLPAMPELKHGMGKHSGCRKKGKMIAMANKFREFFGLPPLVRGHPELQSFPPVRPTGDLHILPFPAPDEMGAHRTPEFFDRGFEGPQEDEFSMRLLRAVAQLRPWEATAISFVLGCGLGVLLRMFFVIGILIVRGRRAFCPQQAQSIQLPAQEVIFVAPPEYVNHHDASVDEKKPLVESN